MGGLQFVPKVTKLLMDAAILGVGLHPLVQWSWWLLSSGWDTLGPMDQGETRTERR